MRAGIRTRLIRLEQSAANRSVEQAQDPLIQSLPLHVGMTLLLAMRRRPRDSRKTTRYSIGELDLPLQLKKQLGDAAACGTWRGDWVPLSDPEYQEMLSWLEANQKRIDAAGLVDMGHYSTTAWCLLWNLRRDPLDVAAIEAVQHLRLSASSCGVNEGEPSPAIS